MCARARQCVCLCVCVCYELLLQTVCTSEDLPINQLTIATRQYILSFFFLVFATEAAIQRWPGQTELRGAQARVKAVNVANVQRPLAPLVQSLDSLVY